MDLKKLKEFKLTPKQKKIIDITVTCVQVAIIILAITVSAIVIANPIASSATVGEGKTKLLPVLTDSMNGKDEYYEANGFDIKTRFKSGDLVIAETPKDNRTLQRGDIVTYIGNVNGYEALITHRIVEAIDSDGDNKMDTYVVQGDVVTATENLHPDKVLAVYKSHLKGVGKAINWLQDSTNFLLVIVIPLALLFIYNIILVVRMVMEYKMSKAKESAGDVAVIDEEEIKRKAIEEYLAQQKANEETSSDTSEDKQ